MLKIIKVLLILAATMLSAEGFNKKDIAFSFGTGDKEMYIVGNPGCEYTKMLFKEGERALSKYRIHVILMEREHLYESPAMIEFILQAKTDEERTRRFKDLILYDSEEYKSPINKFRILDFIDRYHASEAVLERHEDYADDEVSFLASYYIEKYNEMHKEYEYDKNAEDTLTKMRKNVKALGTQGTPTVYSDNLNELNWPRLVRKSNRYYKLLAYEPELARQEY